MDEGEAVVRVKSVSGSFLVRCETGVHIWNWVFIDGDLVFIDGDQVFIDGDPVLPC